MESTAMEYARMNLNPSISSLFFYYASFSTSLMLFREAYRELVPKRLETFLVSKLSSYFSWKSSPPSVVTLIIDDSWGGFRRNKLVKAANLYLSGKIGPGNRNIRIGKFKKFKKVVSSLVEGETVVDIFDGIEITWQLVVEELDEGSSNSDKEKHYELTFDEKFREKIVGEYFNHIVKASEARRRGDKVLKLYTLIEDFWDPIDLRHPANFDTIAMDSDLKKAVMNDLDRFLGRKEYYKRVGKAWKRCYLLYGPPGTGKSSLIAAMANYLKFDIFELELPNILSEYDLRTALLEIESKCVIVIEDIDCNSERRDEQEDKEEDSDGDDYCKPLSPLDVLNCVQGLRSSCDEERLIVLTTNHREKLESELLLPGKIDMEIHMSYCSVEGFRVLAHNYLGIEEHQLFDEIDGLIQSTEVTPASLAEELLKSDDPDTALGEVVHFLKRIKMEKDRN